MAQFDPDFEEWMRQQQDRSAAAAAPRAFDDVGFDQAAAADRAAREDRSGLALLSQFSEGLSGRRKGPVQVPGADDSRLKEWVLKDKLRRDSIPAAPKPVDPSNAPLSEIEIAELEKRGIDPRLARERGEALRLITSKDAADRQVAAQRAADADRDASRGIAATTAEVTREAARARAEDRQKENESKSAMGIDFEPLDNTSPLYADEAGKRAFLNTAIAARKLARPVDTIRQIVKKGVNPATLSAEDRTRLNSAIANIRVQIKTIDQLGVIAGPDMPQFISPQIDNPAEFQNYFLKVLNLKDPLVQLDQLEQNMAGGVADAAEGYGVRFSPNSHFKKFMKGAAAPSETIRVRRKSDGKVGSMPASNFNPDLYDKVSP